MSVHTLNTFNYPKSHFREQSISNEQERYYSKVSVAGKHLRCYCEPPGSSSSSSRQFYIQHLTQPTVFCSVCQYWQSQQGAASCLL